MLLENDQRGMMICDKINAGLARARSEGKKLGRQIKFNVAVTTSVRPLREHRMSIKNIAKQLKIGVAITVKILESFQFL